MTETAPRKRQGEQPGWDALMEDVLGLSIRGLVTIRDLFVRPNAVFEAARHLDWLGRYTPTIRLLFSVVALMMLLSYFWAGEHSPNYQFVLQNYEQAKEANPDIREPADLAEQFFGFWSLFFPFLYVIIHGSAAWFIRVWGRGTTYTVRLRLYFGCILPAMTVSLILLRFMPWIPVEQVFEYSMASVFVGALITFAIFIRGNAGSYGTLGLWWRGILFAFLVFVLDLSVSTATGLSASSATVYLSSSGIALDF